MNKNCYTLSKKFYSCYLLLYAKKAHRGRAITFHREDFLWISRERCLSLGENQLEAAPNVLRSISLRGILLQVLY